MKQQSEHLSNAQIEQYGKRASGAGPETEAWVETHLDDCPSCRSRVLEFQRTQFALLPDPKVNTVSSSNCPSEDDLRNLAAGLCADPIATKLTAHAATCEPLRPTAAGIYRRLFRRRAAPKSRPSSTSCVPPLPNSQQQKAREMLKQVRTTVPRPLSALDLHLAMGADPGRRSRLRCDCHQHLVYPARYTGKSREAAGPGIYGATDDGDALARSEMGPASRRSG